MTTDESSLAAFLRSRRERLKPEQVGLASHGRRRTPGLRRGELATLAGLSVEYLERLEQGRDTNPSGAVLTALADALHLSVEEKQHLALLAMRQHSATLLPAPPRSAMIRAPACATSWTVRAAGVQPGRHRTRRG
ncbi:helix-turn-helix domain-containing protein [Streptomyces sp. WM6378]|uniref:helix-turn-helix domain-containing protein n=1 Tax=Streptomyces sp. WM6378 TaxID=1415557 RepID=UPI0006AF7B73